MASSFEDSSMNSDAGACSEPDGGLPLVVLPWSAALAPSDLGPRLRACAERYLAPLGSILFRGFGVRDESSFREFVSAFARPERRIEFAEFARGGETDTVPDARRSLCFEELLNFERPERLWLACTGWPETTRRSRQARVAVADGREVYRRVPPRIRREWLERGLCSGRVYGGPTGIPWSQAFETAARVEVEARCRALGIRWEWRERNRLLVAKRTPATMLHPVTRQPIWSNDAHLCHSDASIPEADGKRELEREICFADGAPIPIGDLAAVSAAVESARDMSEWEEGDVVLLDNLSTAHAFDASGAARIWTAKELRAQNPATMRDLLDG
jgi:hypothetical protein